MADNVVLARNTDEAPQNDRFAQTVAFSHYNNISAQLPIDPVSNQIVVGGVAEQTAQCLKNIKAVLTSIDVPFDDIVKVTVFLKNLSDIDAVNEVYTRFFPDSGIARAVAYMPARTVVEVAELPMHALVQIEAVVSHGDGTPPQEVEARHGLIIEANDTDAAPVSPLSSQSVAFSHYNNISAQLGVDAASGKLVAGGVARAGRAGMQEHQGHHRERRPRDGRRRQGERLPEEHRRPRCRRGRVRPLLHRHPCVPRRRHRCAAHGRARADRRHLRQRRGHPADQVARLSIG